MQQWIAKTRRDLEEKLKTHEITLNMMPEHEAWVQKQGIKYSFWGGTNKWHKKILARMITDEKFFQEAHHQKGIDFFPTPKS